MRAEKTIQHSLSLCGIEGKNLEIDFFYSLNDYSFILLNDSYVIVKNAPDERVLPIYFVLF